MFGQQKPSLPGRLLRLQASYRDVHHLRTLAVQLDLASLCTSDASRAAMVVHLRRSVRGGIRRCVTLFRDRQPRALAILVLIVLGGATVRGQPPRLRAGQAVNQPVFARLVTISFASGLVLGLP